MYKFFFKKSFVPVLELLTAFTISAGVAFATGTYTYQNYSDSKEESTEQFDFDTNDISDSEIVLDGHRDAVYQDSVLSFGTKTGSTYNVDLYTYHSNQALYMFFDVTDKHVIKRAIGNNNAQDEDGIEISIDVLLNGGSTPQTDDLKIYLGVSGFDKVLKGNGKAWGSTMIGFGGELKTSIKPGTIVNDSSGEDTGYCLEYRIPYISLFGEANKETPLAFAFVESTLSELTGSRTRTGMSGHDKFKIPTEATPYAFPVLAKSNKFYSRTDFANLNESSPSATGKVFDKDANPVKNANVQGWYSKSSAQKFDTKTDENGFFFFENVEPTDDFIVNVSKSGYIETTLTYDSQNLVNANGVEYYQDFVLMPSGAAMTTVTGQIKVPAGNSAINFKVSLVGHDDIYVMTDSSGNFSINVYQDVSNRLSITKNNFEPVLVDVESGVTTLPIIKVYTKLMTLATPVSRSPIVNFAQCGLSRSDEGLFVKLSSPYLLEGEDLASLYVNTSENAGFNSFANGDYRVDFDGQVVKAYAYSEEANDFVYSESKSALAEFSIQSNVLYETSLFIQNEVFDISSTTTIGVAFDFYNGQSHQESSIDDSVIVDKEIDPFSTATYLRFDGYGKAFFSNSNANTSFLYYYHAIDGSISEDIPNNADRIYMSYERNNDGLTLKVMVNNTFGTHFNTSYGLTGAEAINLILDLDEYRGASWALFNTKKPDDSYYDINFRIYSDDTICYINSNDVRNQASNQMWWSDKNHNNGVAKNFTLTSKSVPTEKYTVEQKSGYKLYTLTLSYSDLKQFSSAPETVTFDGTSRITACMFEVSETSKTTIRFYTNAGDGWVFNNKALSKSITGSFANQSTYISLPKK